MKRKRKGDFIWLGWIFPPIDPFIFYKRKTKHPQRREINGLTSYFVFTFCHALSQIYIICGWGVFLIIIVVIEYRYTYKPGSTQPLASIQLYPMRTFWLIKKIPHFTSFIFWGKYYIICSPFFPFCPLMFLIRIKFNSREYWYH